MYKWKVCPVQGRQLKDVDPNDLFGDFRICKTYKSGGGYDQFPSIALKRGIVTPIMKGIRSVQFVVQLYGCHLRCPYCYVTKDGVFGEHKEYTSKELGNWMLKASIEKSAGVFHLMGGSPAIYLSHWPEILDELKGRFLFHSDLLLTENYYTIKELEAINRPETLYAVNIKGVSSGDYFENTGTHIDWPMFWLNLSMLKSVGLNFYITFTAPDPILLPSFKRQLAVRYGREILKDSFIIPIKSYEALKDGPAWKN